jgi:hypothetical protein
MRTFAKMALCCAFFFLVSNALSSQTASSTTARQTPRIYEIVGVSSIAGQPFSADLEIERTQTLADGSHIHTSQHMKVFRDSEGRLRNEIYSHQGGVQGNPEVLISVEIVDATANVKYALMPQSHIAQRRVVFIEPTQASTTLRPTPAPTQQPPLSPKSVSESLGVQTIEGISAEGHRYTTTWPVNSQGNDAPLVNINEGWISAEMGLRLLVKTSSPRIGEQVSRFTNINRGEPDPSLFQVPPEYTIKDVQ